MSPDTIILRNLAGRSVGTIPYEFLLADGLCPRHEERERTEYTAHFHVRYNKRGNIKHAIRKERIGLTPLSNKGEGFEQTLESGRVVFALRGVLGSERIAAA